jgi:hypothetical protein
MSVPDEKYRACVYAIKVCESVAGVGRDGKRWSASLRKSYAVAALRHMPSEYEFSRMFGVPEHMRAKR